ncbi:MAG: 5-amino-6-(D-ribitylamino)uracil--L-tyrosine 4-hydroxyphenyl transferase CofH [Myxococcales bacterium]
MTALEGLLRPVSARVRAVLEACLEGRELDVESALELDAARGRDLLALGAVADELRTRQVGDVVTYVVNRNINFTNVCVKACKFCAFSRDLRSEQGYLLSTEEVVRRAQQARDFGATEVCLQAGLLPEAQGRLYVEIVRAVKRALPELHIHAFSPEEIKYGAALSRVPVREFLLELKEAGLGSLPGTSAEILDDGIRARIAPGRISTQQWIDVITTAHELGIPTTSTMMFGHVETARDRVAHLALLRDLQKRSGGFTEFVPLSFVHAEAPLFLEDQDGAVSAGPTGDAIVRLYATARLMLGATFKNIQASWVKEGLRTAQSLLSSGVNDLGGTLMNESISTAAGAQHGQLVAPRTLRRLIRDSGRVPGERSTRYQVLRTFDANPGAIDEREPLDTVHDSRAVFGSYQDLLNDPRFHYEWSPDAHKRSLRVLS